MSANIILAISCAIMLNGCVAVWGQPYKIDTQTPDIMTVQYDKNFIDQQDIVDMARAHCAQSNKQAILQRDDRNLSGISTATFLCRTQAEYRP